MVLGDATTASTPGSRRSNGSPSSRSPPAASSARSARKASASEHDHLPFDQQPLEAQAAIEAARTAFAATGDPRWFDHAKAAWDWFFGANDRGVVLADLATGRCRDGITPRGANENCGAESILAFQLAHYSMLALARAQQREFGGRRMWGSRAPGLTIARCKFSTSACTPTPRGSCCGRSTSAGRRRTRPAAARCKLVARHRRAERGRRSRPSTRACAATSSRATGRPRRCSTTASTKSRRRVDLDCSGFSRTRKRLIGAFFCHEYTYAAAALMNPSIVPHPDQSGMSRRRRAAS